jgi:nucleoside 2-deoxyribosyltransferase
MARPFRLFVSFDFDRDKVLKAFIVGQSRYRNSPFEVADWSMKEAGPSRTWKAEAERRIARCDRVLVMVGPETHRASGVLAEVGIARRLGKPMAQMIGYRNSSPTRVPNAGRLYRWSWPNLEKLLKGQA